MTPGNTPDGLFFDLITEEEVENAHQIEEKAFTPSEAGSLEAFKMRQAVASTLFLGAFLPPRILVGYANATLANTLTLTHDSMSKHDPHGTSACIHAIAVVEDKRGRGIGTALMKEYVRRLRHDSEVGATALQRILLICHENLISFYERIGFELQGKSSVVHGPDPWFGMIADLGLESSRSSFGEGLQRAAHGSIPPDILGALTTPCRDRPSVRSYSRLSREALISSSEENALDILCPRCGSIVLKAGVAKYRREPTRELDPPGRTPPAPLRALPSSPAEIDWWLVTPSPLAFENIAFSKPISLNNPMPAGPSSKLLACAECDLGAFGLCEEGGTEFWIAASRVGYRPKMVISESKCRPKSSAIIV